MNECYIWYENQIITIDPNDSWGATIDDIPPHLHKLPCLDTSKQTPSDRFGKFGEDFNGAWNHIPFSDFPAEFKLQLLLLGIS